MPLHIRLLSCILSAVACLGTSTLQASQQGQRLGPAPDVVTAKTPLGVLSHAHGELRLNGKRIPKLQDPERVAHISTHYAYPTQTDVLVQYQGAEGCPAMFRWYSITTTIITRSPLFGNCSAELAIEKKPHSLTVTSGSFGPAAISGEYSYDGQILSSLEPVGTSAPSKQRRSELVWELPPKQRSAERTPPVGQPVAPSAQKAPASPAKSKLVRYYEELSQKAALQRGPAAQARDRASRSNPSHARYKTVPFDPDADPLFFVNMAYVLGCEVREGLTHEVQRTVVQFWRFPSGCMNDGGSQAYGAAIILFPNGKGRLAILMSPGGADAILKELDAR